MKQIIVLLFAVIFTQSLNAAYNTKDYTVEKGRKVRVTNTMKKVNNITRLTIRYIISTLDTTPTRAEIENYFNKKDQNIWKNYRNENCTEINGNCVDNTTNGIKLIFDTSNKRIEFQNIMGDLATLSSNENSAYIDYSNFDEVSYFSTDKKAMYFDFIDFPSLESTLETIEECNNNTQLTCSTTAPTDTTQYWKKPKGDGSFNLYIYDNVKNKWINKGKQEISKKTKYYLSDNVDLSNVPGVKGEEILVQESDGWYEYIHDGTKWDKKVTDTNSQNGPYNGIGGILDMATTKFSSPGSSSILAEAPNGEWSGTKKFIKVDEIQTGGFWESDDKNFIVTNNINSLAQLDSSFSDGTVAWIANSSSKGIYKLKKNLIASEHETLWNYQATNYANLLDFKTALNNNDHGKYFFVSKSSKYFTFNGEFFDSMFETNKHHVSDITRNEFTPISGDTYLLKSNDCTILTCNGESVNDYYAGATIDGLYSYYYTNSGKNLNSLTDASPYNSWATFWNDAASAVQWTGSNFGDVPNGAILLKETLNGSIVYSYNGNFINKLNGYIIPGNKLPSSLNASTVNITKYNSSNYVDVTNLDTFVIDTNLDVGYKVNLNGSGFTNKKLERCTNYDNDNLWSDDCINTSNSASVAISNGSRSDLITPTSNNANRINITKQVGPEENYTTTGVQYASDTSYFQWWYSNSGKITNSMLDPIPCSWSNCYSNTLAKNVEVAINIDSTILKYESNRWIDKTTNRKIIKKLNEYHTDNAIVDYAIGKANNGLYYDSGHDKRNWSSANALCINRNMRLPAHHEVGFNKVPSYISWTWCSTKSPGYSSGVHYDWNGNTIDGHYDYGRLGGEYVRCVK